MHVCVCTHYCDIAADAVAEGDEPVGASTMHSSTLQGQLTTIESPPTLTSSGINPSVLIPSLEADGVLAKERSVVEVPFKEGKKRKMENKGRRRKHSSKGKHKDQFLQYGMGAGRLHLNPEYSFYSV